LYRLKAITLTPVAGARVPPCFQANHENLLVFLAPLEPLLYPLGREKFSTQYIEAPRPAQVGIVVNANISAIPCYSLIRGLGNFPRLTEISLAILLKCVDFLPPRVDSGDMSAAAAI